MRAPRVPNTKTSPGLIFVEKVSDRCRDDGDPGAGPPALRRGIRQIAFRCFPRPCRRSAATGPLFSSPPPIRRPAHSSSRRLWPFNSPVVGHSGPAQRSHQPSPSVYRWDPAQQAGEDLECLYGSFWALMRASASNPGSAPIRSQAGSRRAMICPSFLFDRLEISLREGLGWSKSVVKPVSVPRADRDLRLREERLATARASTWLIEWRNAQQLGARPGFGGVDRSRGRLGSARLAATVAGTSKALKGFESYCRNDPAYRFPPGSRLPQSEFALITLPEIRIIAWAICSGPPPCWNLRYTRFYLRKPVSRTWWLSRWLVRDRSDWLIFSSAASMVEQATSGCAWLRLCRASRKREHPSSRNNCCFWPLNGRPGGVHDNDAILNSSRAHSEQRSRSASENRIGLLHAPST